MKSKNIFFVGIGGKGLNGIAKICLEKGFKVFGVDTADKPEIDSLIKNGAIIYRKHSKRNINKSIDMVVYSSIMKKKCPEIVKAKECRIRLQKRSEFLGELIKNDFKIAVSGSHGKSTTTAILGLSMINSGIDATIYGGAYTKEFNGYNHLGKTKYTILESCEFDRSFFNLVSDVTIITSIEKNHLEYYKDEREMKDAFRSYFKMHKLNSLIVANGDDLNIREVTANLTAGVKYFGFNNQNDYVIKVHQIDEFGSAFSVFERGNLILSNIKINLPGQYNIKNFVAPAIVMYELGLPLEGISKTAQTFWGVRRRFETRISKTGQILVDDFAHHPTQVKNLFDGIRQFYPDKKVYAVFQPRQYNLIRNFLTEYGKSFKKADEIIVTDIVQTPHDTPKDVKSLKTKDVSNSIQTYSRRPVVELNRYDDIYEYLKYRTDQNSVIMTIGAGDIYKVRDMFLV